MARPGWLVALAVIAACRDRVPPEPVAPPVLDHDHDHELAALRGFEQQRRAAADFATLPPSDVALGPDPYRVAALHGGGWVGLLRGASAVVLLDRDGVERDRIAAPRTPGGLAVSADDDILVVGEAERALVHYRRDGDHLARVATIAVDALGLRDVALAPDGHAAYVVEERDGRVLALALARGPAHALRATATRELGRCHGPIQVAALADYVAVDCLLDHTIELRRGDDVARIHHDGPLWRFALAAAPDGGLIVAAGGVEDHALEREDGGFGYIDSFIYLYRLYRLDRRAAGAAPVRLAAINTSELGVVTPKWLAIRARGAGVAVTAAGYASARSVTATWLDLASAPVVTQGALLPGVADASLGDDGALIAADPLLDAWVVRRDGAPRVVAVAGQPRALASRLGELLFFTTLMAPWNASDGKLSRFTCETCHHEGYVDGRTHYTGRDRVFATTRPLLGLFNNRPYFSRALDKTMAQMVHAEFRVANRHNGRDPWFALERGDAPWLAVVPGAPARLAPDQLREAFMAFLMDFTPRANPAALDHARFTERERAGARVFRDHCATCHAARLVADDPASLVPFERWEPLVLSPSGPIVWSNAAYAQTGVVPYVHASGARVPSLRRLYKKWPYFTNGSARSLRELVARFAATPAAAYHADPPAGAAALTADDQAALRAFLDLL